MNIGIVVEDNGNWKFFNEICHELNKRHSLNYFIPQKSSYPIFNERINRYLNSRHLSSLIKKNDVVFFEWVGPFLAELSHLRQNFIFVTRLHSYELYEWAEKVEWKNVARVILVSKSMQQKFLELFPDNANKTTCIYHGVDITKFYPPIKRTYMGRIGMIGTFLPIKRFYEMILAIYEAKQQGLIFQLYLAGLPANGTEYRYTVAMKTLINKLGISDQVKIFGYITDTAAWYHDIDIFISNSYWEGAQVALMEAMASGCFCLAHFWDGADEMLPVSQLYITQSELIEKLTTYHQASINNQQEKQMQMRQLACEKFNIKRTIEEFDHLLINACV